MNRKYSLLKTTALALCLSFSLFACSVPKILPDSEFNTLIVDADVAIHDGRWDDASAKLDQAIMLQPNNLNVKLKQGLAYQLSGKLALAHNAYQQIIDAAPNPTGKNIEIVRAAKTNQAKLGFKPLEPVVPPVDEASVSAESSAVEPIAIPADTVEAKELIAEVAAASDETQPVSKPEQDVVAERIEAWLAAWQEQRVEDYLAFYQSDYRGSYSSHAEWRKQRDNRIKAAKDINISIASLKVELAAEDKAIAEFTQTYQSAIHTDRGLKTLHLQKVQGSWLITREEFSQQ